MIGPYSPPLAELTDRVDVLRASQFVQEGRVVPLDECVVAFDVPCKITELSALSVATMLGAIEQNAFNCDMLDEPRVEMNDVLRVVDSRLPSGKRTKYAVRVVRRLPSPHDCQRQNCDLANDIGGIG